MISVVDNIDLLTKWTAPSTPPAYRTTQTTSDKQKGVLWKKKLYLVSSIYYISRLSIKKNNHLEYILYYCYYIVFIILIITFIKSHEHN